VQQVERRGAFGRATEVVLPDRFVDEVVEVEIFQMLELGLAGGEQFFAHLHMGVHRTADIEQDQQLYRVAPLRAHLYVQQTTVARGVIDGPVQIQFVLRALAGELAQPTQGYLDVARAQFDLII